MDIDMDFPEENITLLFAALAFSAAKHRHQRRKDAEASPYINHPIEVAEVLWRVGGVRDIAVLVSALLHDVIEDTGTTPEEVRCLFGDHVLSLILELSDDKSLPRAERKRLQIERSLHLSFPAKLIAIADKICNVRDVTHSSPARWPIERKIEYLDWTEKAIEGIRGCNRALEDYYDQVLREGRERLVSCPDARAL